MHLGGELVSASCPKHGLPPASPLHQSLRLPHPLCWVQPLCAPGTRAGGSSPEQLHLPLSVSSLCAPHSIFIDVQPADIHTHIDDYSALRQGQLKQFLPRKVIQS